jgi:hypothetical protein
LLLADTAAAAAAAAALAVTHAGAAGHPRT